MLHSQKIRTSIVNYKPLDKNFRVDKKNSINFKHSIAPYKQALLADWLFKRFFSKKTIFVAFTELFPNSEASTKNMRLHSKQQLVVA